MARGLMVTYRIFVEEKNLRSLGTHWCVKDEATTVPVSFIGPDGLLLGGVADARDVHAYLALGPVAREEG